VFIVLQILCLLPEVRAEPSEASPGQRESKSPKTVGYNFVVQMFDSSQTVFNIIQHFSESFYIIQQGNQTIQQCYWIHLLNSFGESLDEFDV